MPSYTRVHYGVILTLFALINAILYVRLGVRLVNDSPRYLEYAQNLLGGFYIDQHNFWYLGYVIYIALIKAMQGDVSAIIVGQYVLSALATISLYQTALLVWRNQHTAFLSALLFLLYFEISSWNGYLLAESLYISATCFALHALTKFYYVRSLWSGVVAGGVVIFTTMIKPTGIALLGASLTVLFAFLLNRVRSTQLKYAVGVIVAALFLTYVNRSLHTFGVMEAYYSGEVIYDITTTGYSNVGFMRIIPPEDLYAPPEHLPQLVKITLFAFGNPLYSAKLFLTKILYLLIHVRPYWSTLHNLFSLVTLLPLYWLFFIGINTQAVTGEIKLFAGTYLLLHMLSVGLTTEDWDGRFLMPMLPVIFLFAAHSMRLGKFRLSGPQSEK